MIRAISHYNDNPVMMFTTSNMQQDLQFTLKYGAAFPAKPINYAQMKGIADVFLAHCSLEVRERVMR